MTPTNSRPPADDGVWIPVSERLPDFDQYVLWYPVAHGMMSIEALDKDGNEWLQYYTHWMPLPKPPGAAAPQKAGVEESVEIRYNSDGTLDEVVGTGLFHLEQMDTNKWWMELSTDVHVWLTAKGKITATVYDERRALVSGK